MKRFAISLAVALPCLTSGLAQAAEISGGIVRVGVLNDISGIFQDTNGMG
jgi:branched-chain amino acid transport system substrate-binding protein